MKYCSRGTRHAKLFFWSCEFAPLSLVLTGLARTYVVIAIFYMFERRFTISIFGWKILFKKIVIFFKVAFGCVLGRLAPENLA